jgi:hypothetical protein
MAKANSYMGIAGAAACGSRAAASTSVVMGAKA